MRKKLAWKFKPESGIAQLTHLLLRALLPLLLLVLVTFDFVAIAALLVLIQKWRIFAVRPRYWFANIRANLVDIFVGLAVVAFMNGSNGAYTQAFWAISYVVWLVWLKSRNKPLGVMVQALVAQALGLVAFYRAFPNASIAIAIIATWVICYACARHFLGAFDEPMLRTIAHIWAWFGAGMAWVLGHWMIDYLFLPQIALVLTVMGYGLAMVYFLDSKEILSVQLKRQLVIVMALLIFIIIVLSDWQDKTV